MSRRRLFSTGLAVVAIALVSLVVVIAALGHTPSASVAATLAPENVLPPEPSPPPVTFPKGDWPWYAQDEITVHPEPPVAGQITRICAEVINRDRINPHQAVLEFGVARFGIGVPFKQIGRALVDVPPNGTAKGCVVWVPPKWGKWCFNVQLWQQGYKEPLISQRNLDIYEPLIPGRPHAMSFPVGPLVRGGTITFTLKQAPGWEAWFEPSALKMEPQTTQWVTLTTVPPEKAILGSRKPVVDVEGFHDGKPIGGFRKLDNPPIPLHRPEDPFFAESEIHVNPYPPRAGEPTEICVDLINISDREKKVAVHFNWAQFGIGLPFRQINGPLEAMVPPNGRRTVCIHWIPPRDGQFCVQVELEILGEVPYRRQFSQRNLDVIEPLQPGVPHKTVFQVGNFHNPFTNPDPQTTAVWFDIDRLLPGWKVWLDPPDIPRMEPGKVVSVTMVVTPGKLPPDGTPVVDIRALHDTQDGPQVLGGFRKIFRPPVQLHRFPDPIYAEREITVQPDPPKMGEPAKICVELYNPTSSEQQGIVRYFWANFGIGLPFQPISGPRYVKIPPNSTHVECIHWIPPTPGKVCLQVMWEMKGYPPQVSQRNLDIDEPLMPGKPHTLRFPVGNPLRQPVSITLSLVEHLPGWSIEIKPEMLTNIKPGDVQIAELTVKPPFSEPLPDDFTPIVDVEAYVHDQLIGGFRKIYRPPVPIHRPQDPIYAESEIFIEPYPPRTREPTLVGVEIRNPTNVSQTVQVSFSASAFGIGLPFKLIHKPLTVTVPARGMVRPTIRWVPPRGGLWCIEVKIGSPVSDNVFVSRRNIDVGEPLEPRIPHSRPFLVRNPTARTISLTLGLLPHLPDWGLELSQDVLPEMKPGETRTVILTVTPPDRLPEDGTPIVDVEAYAEGMLIGGFRKIYRPPVPIHRPKDPIYAESEIGVDPYPVIPGQPVKLSVEVFNPTDKDRIVTVTFSVARFGIGLPFSTTHITPNPIRIFVPKFGAAKGLVIWNPPMWRGKFCVKVELETEGHEPVWSQRNIDVGEPLKPGKPHTLIFPVGSAGYTEPVSVNLGLVHHRDGWDISLSETLLPNVVPGQPVSVSLTVTPPLQERLGKGTPIVDVEAFVDGELIGGIRKLDRPPIPLHKPHEKGYAESEIIIDPYPPQVNQPAKLGTVVQNTSESTMTVNLRFGWAKFGMGIPFTTTGITPYTRSVTLGPEISKTTMVSWTPQLSGKQCVIIELLDADDQYEPQRSQRNVFVTERPPCGHTRTFTFTVYNDSPFTATIDMAMITFNVPSHWIVTVSPSPTMEVGPFGEGVATVNVHIPCPKSLSGLTSVNQIDAIQAESGSTPLIDVEGYREGELVGGIELQFTPHVQENLFFIYLPSVQRR